jgi:predicted nucleotidyltransferase
LVRRFQPEQIVLFGSYAYGEPTLHSDVDLLIVKPLLDGPVREAVAIRRAWREIRTTAGSLPFDLLLESPEGHLRRLSTAAGFYDEIIRRGLRLV